MHLYEKSNHGIIDINLSMFQIYERVISMNKKKIEKIIKEDTTMLDQNKKEEVKEEIETKENTKTKTVEEKTTTNKTKEEEKKKHKIGVRTPIYKKMGITLIGINNKEANDAVMKLNNSERKILQGAIIDSTYCKVYRKVVTSLYDEKYKDNIASLFSNKNIKCLLEDSENSLALATKLKEEIKNITNIKEKETEENSKAEKAEETFKEENKVKEEVKTEEKNNDDKVKEEVKTEESIKEENKTEKVNSTDDHSNYDNSWANYEPKGGSRLLSSLGLKIAFLKYARLTR